MADDRPTSARAPSIAAIICAIDAPRFCASVLSAVQNIGSSETLVRCPAMEIDRLSGLFAALNAALGGRHPPKGRAAPRRAARLASGRPFCEPLLDEWVRQT